MEEKLTDQERARRDKLPRYAEMGVDPYGQKFERSDSVQSAREKAAGKSGEELEANHIHVSLAGRIMALRKMGKAAFMNIKDVTGNIQCWLGINVLGEEMEAFGLFHIASSFNREASCIVTAVDSKFSDVVLSGEERQNSLNEMITLALESIIK